VFVDLAGLALGTRDPAAVPGFSTSMSRASSGAGCRWFGPECRPMLTTDARQRAGIYRVDHDEDSIACVSRLCGLASVAKRQTAPINPANLDAALEKDPKHNDGFDHSSA
jgi:hypothetical protein